MNARSVVKYTIKRTLALNTPRVSGFAIDSWIPVSRFVVELPSLAIFISDFLCNKPLELGFITHL